MQGYALSPSVMSLKVNLSSQALRHTPIRIVFGFLQEHTKMGSLWSMKKSKLQTSMKCCACDRRAASDAKFRLAGNCLNGADVAQRRLPVTVEFVLICARSRKVACYNWFFKTLKGWESTKQPFCCASPKGVLNYARSQERDLSFPSTARWPKASVQQWYMSPL